MRILYCNKYNFRFSGTEAYLFEAMEAMRAHGHETALFSMADPRGKPTQYDENLAPAVNFHSATGLFNKARLAARAIYSSAARMKLRGMIAAFRPDVAHVRNIYHHLSPSILWELKARGVPILYHVNDFKLLCPAYNLLSRSGEICERCGGGKFRNAVVHGCHGSGLSGAAVLAMEAYFHRWIKTYEKCVDLILAPSDFVRDKFIANGWAETRIEVLPHFQDLPSKTLPHPGRSAHILYFGRLSLEKGVQDVVAAMAHLPNVQLVVAGDGPQKQDLEEQAARLNLRNVRFAGHVSGADLERLIAESQFTLFPSRAYETFGKSILESYAHGRAVIASNLGPRRELVKDGETGLLYRAGNVDELAAAIRFLHGCPELAKKFGEAGCQLVGERYTREQHLKRLTDLYRQLIKHAQVLKNRRTKPLRVAFIGGRGVIGKYSGVETWYEQVGSRLVRSGHRVTVYCRSYFTPNIPHHEGMNIVRLPAIRTKHLETFFHSFLSTLHACFSECDIVHYQTLGPALFSSLPRIFGKTTIVSVQGLDWQRAKWSWFARMVLQAGEWAAAHSPNKTMVVSRELETRFANEHCIAPVYIPNGTELRSRTPATHLQQFGLTSDSYVLFLGRFSPEKNCGLLIQAFKGISTNMKLVFAGGSSHTNEYVSRLRSEQDERIIFLDWLTGDVLNEILTNAAIFVLPSDIEGMSLALLDAMGAGVCVLASDIPENRETIDDTGFLFRRGDVRDLGRMLNLLISNVGGIRARSAEKARLRIRENYLWESVAAEIEKTYLEVCGQKAPKPAVPVRAAA